MALYEHLPTRKANFDLQIYLDGILRESIGLNRKSMGYNHPFININNIKGNPKTILLDADLEKIKISMSRSELTNGDIEAALKAELRQQEIQPFWDGSIFRSIKGR